MLRFHTARRTPGLPPSGSKAIFIGDSISNLSVLQSTFNGGKHAAALCTAYGWTMLGANAVANANFETDAASWTTAGATLASDATHAQFGTKSMKLTPTSTSVIVNPEGDSGAIRMGMRAGQTWTFSTYLWVPTANTGTWFLQLLDGPTGGPYVGTTATVVAANGWQRVTATRTIGVSSTESFVRIAGTGITVGQAIWVDGAQLEPNASASGWIDTLQASAQLAGCGGTTLSGAAQGGGAGNFLDNIATRFTPYMPADLVSIYYGSNDIGLVGTGLTRDVWRDNLTSALRLVAAQRPAPVIAVCSLGWLTAFTNDSTAVAGWGVGTQRQHVYADMNNVTQQVARDFGAVWVDLSGMVVGDTSDGLHPTQAGQDKIVTLWKKAFGQ